MIASSEVALGWSRIDSVIRDEIRKVAVRVPGFDTDDLLQEARIAVFRRPALRETTSVAYLRSSIRNTLLNMKRAAYAAKRYPTLPRYQGHEWVPVVSYEAFYEGWGHRSSDWQAHEGPGDRGPAAGAPADYADPDSMLAALRLARRYRVYEQHMKSYGDLFPAAAEAPELPVLGDEDFPDCHVDAQGNGYDETQARCHTKCPDKFTCLPRAIAHGLVAGPENAVDTEVHAVRSGLITYARGVDRMKRRLAIYRADGVVPDELLPTAPIARELPEQPLAPLLADVAPPPPPPPVDAPAPAPRKRVLKKPLAKVSPPPAPAQEATRRRGGTYGPGKLPRPGKLTEGALAMKLEEATEKLGMPRGRSLEVGHVIVKRRHRTGKPDVEVVIERDGFRLTSSGETYPSLSAVATAAELPYSKATTRIVTGTTYFSLVLNHNVEVRDRAGTVICTKRMP